MDEQCQISVMSLYLRRLLSEVGGRWVKSPYLILMTSRAVLEVGIHATSDDESSGNSSRDRSDALLRILSSPSSGGEKIEVTTGQLSCKKVLYANFSGLV